MICVQKVAAVSHTLCLFGKRVRVGSESVYHIITFTFEFFSKRGVCSFDTAIGRWLVR